jgi:O-antigen/teichoic acid export membrane protein
LDVYRHNRRLGFGRVVLTSVVPQVVTTLAAWPLAATFRDYRAVLCIFLGNSILATLMSHLVAKHYFFPRFDLKWTRESLKFGLPQFVTGLVQFGNFQGDSIIIAAAYSLSQLGEYSVAMTMAMAPGLAILRVGGSISLPLLAEVKESPSKFSSRYGLYAQLMALIGCLISLAMLLCGEQAIRLMFGAKYAGVGVLATWLIAAQSLRILRGAAVAAATSHGDTVNNLISSLWRLSGLGLALVVGLLRWSLTWFAIAGFVGEAVALVSALTYLNSRHSIAPKVTIKPLLLGTVSVVFGCFLKWAFSVDSFSYANWAICAVLVGVTMAGFFVFFPELRLGISRMHEERREKTSSSLLARSFLEAPTKFNTIVPPES